MNPGRRDLERDPVKQLTPGRWSDLYVTFSTRKERAKILRPSWTQEGGASLPALLLYKFARIRLEMGTRRIPSLDGPRAISIGLVLLAHLEGTPIFFRALPLFRLAILATWACASSL
jgi:hypothetical protein